MAPEQAPRRPVRPARTYNRDDAQKMSNMTEDTQNSALSGQASLALQPVDAPAVGGGRG